MREQGSLKGEGMHRGNLFVDNSEQNLEGPVGRARIGEICSSIILVKICQVGMAVFVGREGTHRGNLFVHNSGQNLPGRYARA